MLMLFALISLLHPGHPDQTVHSKKGAGRKGKKKRGRARYIGALTPSGRLTTMNRKEYKALKASGQVSGGLIRRRRISSAGVRRLR